MVKRKVRWLVVWKILGIKEYENMRKRYYENE